MFKKILSDSYHDLMYKHNDYCRHLSNVREKLRVELLAIRDYDRPRYLVESDIERVEEKMSDCLRVSIYRFFGKPTF